MEKNKQNLPSKTTNKQLAKQSNNYLEAYTRTQAEKKIIDAIFYPKIGSNSSVVQDTLVETIAKWQYYVGIKNPSGEDIALISTFIQTKFSELTCQEIELAVNLCLEGKLDIEDVKPYGVFSPLYVSTILNAYIDYKTPLISDVVQRYERLSPPETQAPKMTPFEQAVFMRELIFNEFQMFKAQGVLNDYLSMVYDFLKKSKRLVITEELKNKAIEQGERMYNEYVSNQRMAGNMVDKFWNIQDKKAKINKMSREYCVMEYFKNVDIEKLLQSIKDDEFA